MSCFMTFYDSPFLFLRISVNEAIGLRWFVFRKRYIARLPRTHTETHI